MKLHHVIFCSLALLLAACSRDEGPAPLDCIKIQLPDKFPGCPNDSANPRVTLNTQAMTVTPPWACADKNTTIEVHIVPPPGAAGTVVIFPKVAENEWPAGTNNSDPSVISIPVPDTGEPLPVDYDYGVDIPGTGKCIDPRFRVL
jgi:hypothetical protein